jgi:hypothetical protein
VRKDARQYFEIETRFGISSIKSYASALKGDAKIGSRLGTRRRLLSSLLLLLGGGISISWWWWC